MALHLSISQQRTNLPECLKATLWQRIASLESYNAEFEMIKQAILGRSSKPSLGPAPKYRSLVFASVEGLTDIDLTVLELACKDKIATGHKTGIADTLFDCAKGFDISRESFDESLEVLCRKCYLESPSRNGRKIQYFRVAHHAFDSFLQSELQDYDHVIRDIGLAIYNLHFFATLEIADAIKQPKVVVNHMLDEMGNKGLFKVHWSGGDRLLSHISPELKRLLVRE